MINTTIDVLNMLNSPRRTIGGRALVYQGSTTPTVIPNNGNLKRFVVDRVGENNKFFGYGVSQKATVELLDKEREYTVTGDLTFRLEYDIAGEYITSYPTFHVEQTETKRDEKTNTLTVVGYDGLYSATAHTFNEITLTAPYTLQDVAIGCSEVLGLSGIIYEGATDIFTTLVYENGANLDGTETIREILDDIAEATQTIYYINADNVIVFANCRAAVVGGIDKAKYFDLEIGREVTLSRITHTTELGDNVSAGDGELEEQVLKDNSFLSLVDEIAGILSDAYSTYEGMKLSQYNCNWRGNPLYEIADWVSLECKDGTLITVPLVNETHTYNGGLSAKASWDYTQTRAEHTNSATLGETLKQTYAKVDKASKQIDMVASETNANSQNISNLQINTERLLASVSNTQETTDGLSEEVANLTTRVNATMTAEDVKLEIRTELENGASKVVTNTGFTFDDEGLTVSKDGSEMSTQITEDGMTVYRDNTAVLTANNNGVNAVNLHATTYLIIGNNSRFEDYTKNSEKRTGCFWIGN